MKTISATTASRQFSDLLDAVERGESITVTRGGKAIADISPARHRSGRSLREALAAAGPLDADFESDVAEAIDFAHAAESDRILVSRDSAARFGDLPGVAVAGPTGS